MHFDHNSLKEIGIFKIQNFISSDECENIINETKLIKADNQKVRVDDLDSEYRVWNAEKVFPSINTFLHSNTVKNISKEFMRDQIFNASDFMVDSLTALLERERNKRKAS